MIKKVYRLNGEVVNIGDWELQKGTDGEIVNPMPFNATSSEEDCVIGWDGGIYIKGDPRSIKQ